MGTGEDNLNNLYLIVTILSIIGAGIIAGIRKLYCKGRKDQLNDSEYKTLKKDVDELQMEVAELKVDIELYRKEQAKRDEKLASNQNKIISELSDIKGFLEGKFGKHNHD